MAGGRIARSPGSPAGHSRCDHPTALHSNGRRRMAECSRGRRADCFYRQRFPSGSPCLVFLCSWRLGGSIRALLWKACRQVYQLLDRSQNQQLKEKRWDHGLRGNRRRHWQANRYRLCMHQAGGLVDLGPVNNRSHQVRPAAKKQEGCRYIQEGFPLEHELMKHPRFSIGRLMGVVGIVALNLWAGRILFRSSPGCWQGPRRSG